MNSQHYTASFSVAQSPAAVFAAVTNPARRSRERKREAQRCPTHVTTTGKRREGFGLRGDRNHF